MYIKNNITNNNYGGNKMNEDNKSIKCDVTSCKFNDDANNYCTLNEIKVSSNHNCDNCSKKRNHLR